MPDPYPPTGKFPISTPLPAGETLPGPASHLSPGPYPGTGRFPVPGPIRSKQTPPTQPPEITWPPEIDGEQTVVVGSSDPDPSTPADQPQAPPSVQPQAPPSVQPQAPPSVQPQAQGTPPRSRPQPSAASQSTTSQQFASAPVVPATPIPVTPAPMTPQPAAFPNSGIPVPTTPNLGIPTSGVPQSPVFPVSSASVDGPQIPPLGNPAAPRIVPTPRRGHRGLIITLVALAVIVVLGGAGTAVALFGDDLTGQPSAGASSAPGGSSSPGTAGSRSSAPGKNGADVPKLPNEPTPRPRPAKPGLEPPTSARPWPANWAKFAAGESTRRVDDLGRLGLTVAVPETWTCALRSQYKDAITTTCSGTVGDKTVGGDITVRVCSEPCDANRKITLRQVEEAWGLRWVRVDGNSMYVETNNVPDQPGRYGVTVVRYWHSKADGPLDRQVVVRLTAPANQQALPQKVVTSIIAATP
jgi:hypothetical protein